MTTYYWWSGGNNGNGLSHANAKTTFSAAYALMGNGDELKIDFAGAGPDMTGLGGSNIGASGRNFGAGCKTFSAYTTGSAAFTSGITLTSANYIILSGLTVALAANTSPDSTCLYGSNCTHIRISGCDFSGGGSNLVFSQNTGTYSEIDIIDTSIHGATCAVSGVVNTSGTFTNFGGGVTGYLVTWVSGDVFQSWFAPPTGNLNRMTINGVVYDVNTWSDNHHVVITENPGTQTNVAYSNNESCHGIYFAGGTAGTGTNRNVWFERNLVYSNTSSTNAYGVHIYSGTVYTDSLRGFTINRNKIYSNSCGLFLSGAQVADSHIFTNNVMYRNTVRAADIYFASVARAQVIENNTIDGGVSGVATGLGFDLGSQGAALGVRFRNNSFSHCTYSIYVELGASRSCDAQYNNFYDAPTYDGPTISTFTNNISSDSLYANYLGDDFSLQPASPNRDTGTTVSETTEDYDGATRPQNSIYDIGAYEYAVASPPPAPTGRVLMAVK